MSEQPLDTRNPLDVTDTPWVRVWNPASGHDPDMIGSNRDIEHTGKWMLFIPSEYLSQVWPAVRDATINGNLGIGAKCATSRSRNPVKLICVYTRDYRDTDDLRRVLIQLRKLGIQQRLNYKTDQTTINVEYGPGSSLYTSPPNSTGFRTPKTRQNH